MDRRKSFGYAPRASGAGPPLYRTPAPTPGASRRPLFLFVGQLVRRKNVGGLLAAATVLRVRGLEFEVWIVGDGPERSALEEQAAALIGEGSRSLSADAAIGAVYEAADVFVMPSFFD